MSNMRHAIAAALASVAVLAIPGSAGAGPELVAYPAGYRAEYVRYAAVDKPERDPPIVRFLYVHPDILAEAQAGGELPHGTVVVMEDHKARLGADGSPLTDAAGRFLPEPEITNIFVQEKRAGWGTEYPAELRNGEWEYARFTADGKPMPDAKFEGCFKCHKGQEAADYTFTLQPFVDRIKK